MVFSGANNGSGSSIRECAVQSKSHIFCLICIFFAMNIFNFSANMRWHFSIATTWSSCTSFHQGSHEIEQRKAQKLSQASTERERTYHSVQILRHNLQITPLPLYKSTTPRLRSPKLLRPCRACWAWTTAAGWLKTLAWPIPVGRSSCLENHLPPRVLLHAWWTWSQNQCQYTFGTIRINFLPNGQNWSHECLGLL